MKKSTPFTSKHTPGPWNFNVGKNGKVDGLPAIRIYNQYDMVIDFAHARGEQDIADARLIAAAPEMLAALKAIFQARAPQLNFDFSNAPDMRMLVAAIEKAEGK